MKTIIRLEEVAMAAAAIVLLTKIDLGIPVWLWFFLFFSPDISMLGYAVNTKFGAFTYNLFHHKGVAIAVGAAGFFLNNNMLTATGLLLFAHSSFDRILGYGLKYPDSFQHTHLGMIGKNK